MTRQHVSQDPFSKPLVTFLLVFFLSLFLSHISLAQKEPTLSFFGATGTIGGSCHLLDTGSDRILLDCGAYMSPKYLGRNLWFPFDAASVDIAAISHAHTDHCGRLPLLVNRGFQGSILVTKPTEKLVKIMLDIQHMILKSEHRSAGYFDFDIDTVSTRLIGMDYGEIFTLPGGSEIIHYPAQHILGSSMVMVRFGPPENRKKLLFTGDFGNADFSILQERAVFDHLDYLIIESTYGHKIRSSAKDQIAVFQQLLKETYDQRGVMIIPSFVLARTQKIVAYIYSAMASGVVNPALNVYIHSPSASTITQLYASYPEMLSDEIKEGISRGSSPFAFRSLYLKDEFSEIQKPAVVIAPSADVTSGQVLNHIKKNVEEPTTKIVFVSSYQSPGSLGEKLADGAKEINIDGKDYKVRAKVYELGGFSGHGDQGQILDWLVNFDKIGQVFIVHGRIESSIALSDVITEKFGWKTTVPEFKDVYNLNTGKEIHWHKKDKARDTTQEKGNDDTRDEVDE